MKFPVTVLVSTVLTTVVSTVVVPLIVSVMVVMPVPIVLVSVRVGGFDVVSQLYTCSRHWHCKAGFVERPVYS
jgi:hypothetical protein